MASVHGSGVEAEADWNQLGSPETYVGYERSAQFASPGGATFEVRRSYRPPERLRLNEWALRGEWTVGRENITLERAGGSIVYRFHARDAHLVLSSKGADPIPFQVNLDAEAPGSSHGIDVDQFGAGLLRQGRLYQLIDNPAKCATARLRSRSSPRTPRRTCSRLANGDH